MTSRSQMVEQLSKMFDRVEKEYEAGEITFEEKESRQGEIMQTWRVIQP